MPTAAQGADHPCLTVATPEPAQSPTLEPAATPPAIPSPVDGSPVPSPIGATPVSTTTAIPTVDPAAAIIPEITALQAAIAACASAGDFSGMSTLVSTQYLNETYAPGQTLTRREFLDAIVPLLPVNPVQLVAVEDVRPSANGATALVTLIVGNQLVRFDSSFVQQGDGDDRRWFLDRADAVAVPRPKGADIVHVGIDDGSYRLAEDRARAPDIVLKGANEGRETHEMLVVRLEGGASTAALLISPGPQFPPGVTYVGQVTIEPGATGELVLVDMSPGNYAIVCLLFDQEGNPYLASGMSAEFEVR